MRPGSCACGPGAGRLVSTGQFSPGAWETSQEPVRATFACLDCKGRPIIDIQTGRQNDGTEDRVRSGQTTFAMLQATCQERDQACRVDGLDLGTAVGWISSYGTGTQAGQTIVAIRNGDMITARIMATDVAIARQNADAVIAHVVPMITRNERGQSGPPLQAARPGLP